MMTLTCWSCGYRGRVRQSYAGLRVRCKRCRAETQLADPRTAEFDAVRWVPAIDAATEAVTVELDTRGATLAWA